MNKINKIFFLISLGLILNNSYASPMSATNEANTNIIESSSNQNLPQSIKMSPAIIAIVDTQYIFTECKVGKNLKEQVEKKRAEYQAQVSSKQKELDKKKAEIEASQGKISQSEYDKKTQAFNEELAKITKDVNDYRMKIEQAFANAMVEVEKAFINIINKMASEYGFNQVDPVHLKIYSKPEMNISNEVLKRLDAVLQKVTLQVK